MYRKKDKKNKFCFRLKRKEKNNVKKKGRPASRGNKKAVKR